MSAPTLPSSQVVEETASVWGSSLRPAGCQACLRAFLVEAKRIGQICPVCARAELEVQPVLLRPEAPELLVPFQHNLAGLRPALETWVNKVWLRSDDFEVNILLQRAIPLYWPMWLVDGDVNGHWQAEAGFDYQVKSSQEAYSREGWQTRDVIETRIRWEPRLGQILRHYDNLNVPALSEHSQLLKSSGAYRLDRARPYQPEDVQNVVLRVPDLAPENAWPAAEIRLTEAAEAECAQAAQAQHIRNFSLRAEYESLHWTQMLLPLYVTWYLDDEGKPRTLYLNGQNGAISGIRLASQKKGWKIAGLVLAVAAALFLIALALLGIGLLFPPATIFGVLAGLLALLVACGAILPAAWPWQWNRHQKGKK